ncbi:hypothetical protein C8J56DRAFT_892187 [Mycena floridula]|nr:hypothetical protein C8J56DRAFT_892187 [Mycena floridula]
MYWFDLFGSSDFSSSSSTKEEAKQNEAKARLSASQTSPKRDAKQRNTRNPPVSMERNRTGPDNCSRDHTRTRRCIYMWWSCRRRIGGRSCWEGLVMVQKKKKRERADNKKIKQDNAMKHDKHSKKRPTNERKREQGVQIHNQLGQEFHIQLHQEYNFNKNQAATETVPHNKKDNNKENSPRMTILARLHNPIPAHLHRRCGWADETGCIDFAAGGAGHYGACG